MKYIKLIFGLLFLSNPYFGPLDYLPDFIGLLMIASSIHPLSEISPSAQSAEDCFKKAAAVSGIQLALFIPVISIINSEPSFNLLYSSAFAILRVIFLIPAFYGLFDCLSYLSDKSAIKISHLKTARASCIIFMLFHCIMSAMPEIVYLTVDEFGLYGEALFPMAKFRNGLMFLCAAIVLAAGIVWFVATTVFVCKLKKNNDLNKCISEDLSKVQYSLKKAVLRAASPATVLMTLSVLLLLTFYIDGKSMIPPYFAPIIHVITILFLRKTVTKKVSIAFSVTASVFGLLLQLGYEIFAKVSHERALFAFNEVKDKFALPFVLDCIYTAFIILSVINVGRMAFAFANEHTGQFWESQFTSHNAKAAKEKLNLLFGIKLCTVLAAVACLVNLYSYAVLYKSKSMNMISLGITLAVSVFAYLIASNIGISVKEKYSSDTPKS